MLCIDHISSEIALTRSPWFHSSNMLINQIILANLLSWFLQLVKFIIYQNEKPNLIKDNQDTSGRYKSPGLSWCATRWSNGEIPFYFWPQITSSYFSSPLHFCSLYAVWRFFYTQWCWRPLRRAVLRENLKHVRHSVGRQQGEEGKQATGTEGSHSFTHSFIPFRSLSVY